MSKTIYFWGYQSPFSNFHSCPAFNHKGYTLYNSEQGFMLEKALMFDKTVIPEILRTRTPAQVKRIGRRIRNYNDSKWDAHRYDAMVSVLRSKFAIPELKKALLSTNDALLVEASPYDKIWGIGLDERVARQTNPSLWPGRNLLGKALMQVRDELMG